MSQTVTALGPATAALATHCRLVPEVTKNKTTSRRPMALASCAVPFGRVAIAWLFGIESAERLPWCTKSLDGEPFEGGS